MAVTVTAVRTGPTQSIADVEATADADVAAVFPHGLGGIPEQVWLVPLLAAFYISTPTVGVVDAVNVNIVMSNAVGSGAVGNQLRIIAHLPHSIVR
jgi:hypothetical protein